MEFPSAALVGSAAQKATPFYARAARCGTRGHAFLDEILSIFAHSYSEWIACE